MNAVQLQMLMASLNRMEILLEEIRDNTRPQTTTVVNNFSLRGMGPCGCVGDNCQLTRSDLGVGKYCRKAFANSLAHAQHIAKSDV